MKLFFAILILQNLYAAEDCSKQVRVVPKTKPRKFLAFVNSNPDLRDSFGQKLEWSTTFEDAYVADIDNDGEKEFIVTDFQGSGNHLGIYVFKERNGKFQFIDGPPDPGEPGHGAWYHGPYFYPGYDTKGELITEFCGATYLSFATGTYRVHTRESYVWKDGKTKDACHSKWVEYERKDFQKLYETKRFEAADAYLKSIARACSDQLDPTLRTWIASDLAITQYQLGNALECKKVVNETKAHPSFMKAEDRARTALDYNGKLCDTPTEEAKYSNFSELCALKDKVIPIGTRDTLDAILSALGTSDCKKAEEQIGKLVLLRLPKDCASSISDLKPLVVLPALKKLEIENSFVRSCRSEVLVKDWSPLKNLKVEELRLKLFGAVALPENFSVFPKSLERLTLHLPDISLEGVELLKLTQLEIRLLKIPEDERKKLISIPQLGIFQIRK